MFTVNSYADNTTTTTVDIDSRPHFDANGYAVINELQFHKTSDTTVAVSKEKDFNTSKIEIPSSISVDDEVRGALRCKISLTNKNDNSKQVIKVDKYFTNLPVITKIKPLIDNYIYKESTSENDIIDYLKTKLDDIGLDIKIENFTNDKKQVKGAMVIINKLDELQRKFELNKVVYDNINFKMRI